jgi:carboxypeptidase T
VLTAPEAALARSRTLRPALVLAAAVALAAGTVPAVGAHAAGPRTAQPLVLRVVHPSPAQVQQLRASADLLEKREGADYFVLGDAATVTDLRTDGFQVRPEQALPVLASARSVSTDASTLATYATFYGGYHTVDAQFQHLRDVAATHPSLATVVDYGDSYRKTRGISTGTDLLAICITHKVTGDCALSPTAPKPRSVLYAAIHARELATAEIAWNWVDYLTTGYGTDSTVTNLLNSTEIWVIPVANPDGRKIVESGGSAPYYQRKNADNARGTCRNPPTSTNQYGVDLNRNATWAWGGPGSTTSACAQEYRGVSAASEPETQAQQALWGKLFADRRADSRSSAAPADTTGTFMSYHSYAGLILYPWGDTNTDAPNATKLLALAKRMSAYNRYEVGQGGEILYSTSGTTDDDLYGRFGVASFTTELGAANTACDGFMPPYSCVASRFWPQERQSLLVLAQAAASPYR